MAQPHKMNLPIIVPIDDSEYSYHALKYAIEFAEKMDAKVIVLNVQPNIQTVNVQRFFSKEEIKEYSLGIGKEILDKTDVLTTDRNVSVEKVIRIGIPKVEICSVAKEFKAHSIVMGSRGLGPIRGTVLGSVSYGVLHEAPCPVTIVP
ncbi:universal stress protein [Virgibacillus sp. LDC-1]|uniref:universal stress protein n=1 Tax=Virgibacillus sp. LDC-1 TaxID=3039856 RepID=UPI0024DED126|nr:universal stress protein [Virgibacillus sp. LDC-1]